jgi:hypothetical protein
VGKTCLGTNSFLIAFGFSRGDVAKINAYMVGWLARLMIIEVLQVFTQTTIVAASGKDTVWLEEVSVDYLLFSEDLEVVVVVADFHLKGG